MAIFVFLCAIFCADLVLCEEQLTVHIIPHSHFDAGWKVAFEAYDYHSKVVLNNAIDYLAQNRAARFIWPETSFFKSWWHAAGKQMHDKALPLLESGRLEIVGGGWVESDELLSLPESVIDQHVVGHKWLSDTLGIKPKVAWQVDVFGHSASTPTLYANMGFESIFVNRVHHLIKSERIEKKELEFEWRDGEGASINAVMMYSHYNSVPELDFSRIGPLCAVDMKETVHTVLPMLLKQSKAYRTSHMPMPWGDDVRVFNGPVWACMFQFIQTASVLYPQVRLELATPSEYLRAAALARIKLALQLPLHLGGFYQYSDKPGDNYWSGLYTTRPELKRAIRMCESRVGAVSALHGLVVSGVFGPVSETFLDGEIQEELAILMDSVRETVALLQHHDAITGTCADSTAEDYLERVAEAQRMLDAVAQASVRGLGCTASASRESPKDGDRVVIFNSLPFARNELIFLNVGDSSTAKLESEEREPIDSDSVNASMIAFSIRLPPLGFRTLFLRRRAEERATGCLRDLPASLETEWMSIGLDKNGFVSAVTPRSPSSRKLRDTISVSMSYVDYVGSGVRGLSSGVYISHAPLWSWLNFWVMAILGWVSGLPISIVLSLVNRSRRALLRGKVGKKKLVPIVRYGGKLGACVRSLSLSMVLIGCISGLVISAAIFRWAPESIRIGFIAQDNATNVFMFFLILSTLLCCWIGHPGKCSIFLMSAVLTVLFHAGFHPHLMGFELGTSGSKACYLSGKFTHSLSHAFDFGNMTLSTANSRGGIDFEFDVQALRDTERVMRLASGLGTSGTFLTYDGVQIKSHPAPFVSQLFATYRPAPLAVALFSGSSDKLSFGEVEGKERTALVMFTDRSVGAAGVKSGSGLEIMLSREKLSCDDERGLTKPIHPRPYPLRVRIAAFSGTTKGIAHEMIRESLLFQNPPMTFISDGTSCPTKLDGLSAMSKELPPNVLLTDIRGTNNSLSFRLQPLSIRLGNDDGSPSMQSKDGKEAVPDVCLADIFTRVRVKEIAEIDLTTLRDVRIPQDAADCPAMSGNGAKAGRPVFVAGANFTTRYRVKV